MVGVNDVVSGYIGARWSIRTTSQFVLAPPGMPKLARSTTTRRRVKFEELLEVFFKVHDPTTLNKQGADEGTQYRSAIFYHDDEQKQIAEEYIKQLNESGDFKKKIVTTLEPASKFYEAEAYHQDYFRNNPNQGYCKAVVAQKVRKFQHAFKDKVKKPVRN